MITILHGENEVKSRDQLATLLSQAKENNFQIERLEAKRLSLADLEQALVSNSLFGEKKLLIIETLHSLPRSKKKNQLINLLNQTNSDVEIILWEKRSLTPTMIKKINPQKVQEFKTSSSTFAWLDSLSGNKKTIKNQLALLAKADQDDGEQMCFAMLARQVRLLITAKDGGELKGHPFVIKKVKSQANNFTIDQLLSIHKRMLDIDQKMKTSTNFLSLKAELDLLLINM